MASGLIQKTAVTSTTLTPIYSGVPSGKTATVNILICNTSAAAASISIGLTNASAGSLGTSDYLEYRTILAPNESLERGGLVLQSGAYVYVSADSNPSGGTIALGCIITGFEV
jgi:hypothetical protein